MIRFVQTFGAHTGRVLTFDREQIRFGRMPDCDVRFDAEADLDASGNHAVVRREAGRWIVVDVGSRNGTWVNGQRVSRTQLSHGDEIEFGRGGPRVKIELLAMAGPSEATAAATPIATPSPHEDTGQTSPSGAPAHMMIAPVVPQPAFPPGGGFNAPQPQHQPQPQPQQQDAFAAPPGGGFNAPQPQPAQPQFGAQRAEAPVQPIAPQPIAPIAPQEQFQQAPFHARAYPVASSQPAGPVPATPAPLPTPIAQPVVVAPAVPSFREPSGGAAVAIPETAAGGERRYGQRTVGLMIEAAVQATKTHEPAKSGVPLWLKLALVVMIVMLCVLSGVGGYLLYELNAPVAPPPPVPLTTPPPS